jgi:hypothetical protein
MVVVAGLDYLLQCPTFVRQKNATLTMVRSSKNNGRKLLLQKQHTKSVYKEYTRDFQKLLLQYSELGVRGGRQTYLGIPKFDINHATPCHSLYFFSIGVYTDYC